MSQVYHSAPFFENFDTQLAFDYYEAIAHRLPNAQFPTSAQHANGLGAISDHFDVFVFDAFGVLNVGGTPIDGAVESVAALRALGKQVRIITNAATFPKPQTIEKFKRLGFDFTAGEIVTSRMAAENAIATHPDQLWGVMAKNDFQPHDLQVRSVLLGDDSEAYDRAEAFLFLSTWEWSNARQELLEASLARHMRPIVVANPDVIAPLETKFSTEAGFTAHRIADLLDAVVEFHGKPFASVFDLVEKTLSPKQNRKRICMIGDTLHTDVLGGAAQGWSTVLVSAHGLFRGHDVQGFIDQSAIVPDWIVPSI